MSKLCACVFHRFLVILLFATILFSIPNVSSRLAFADSAATNGNAEGNGDGVGTETGGAAVNTSSGSTAGSNGKHNADGATTSRTIVVVNSDGSGSVNKVKISISAKAYAKSEKRRLSAAATAASNATSNSSDDESNADALTNHTGTAMAHYDRNGAVAAASSSSGGYAYAATGTRAAVEAYVPGGTTTVTTKGRRTTAIAYAETGSFSIAITNGKRSRAITGTTENVEALAAGNVRAAIKSAMYAEANASPRQVSAFASSTANALAHSATGSARGYGHAYAFAKVTRSGNRMVVAVASSNSRNGCGARWWQSSTRNSRCVVSKKVVSLKGFKVVRGKVHLAKTKTNKKRIRRT